MNWGEAHSERNPQGMTDCDTYDQFMKCLEDWEQNESRTDKLAGQLS